MPEDVWFDVLTITCLVVFTLEIFLSCLGKDDYMLGFFFWLDVISTVTLILDLTAVREEMEKESGDEGSDSLRSSRAARGGARLGRVVRILRLVRLIKLYKNYIETKKKMNEKKAMSPGEDDDWDDADVQERELEETSESRVGKKFSELTTRHVILLVLTMLLVLPQFGRDLSELMPTSATYGADVVYEAFDRYRVHNSEDNREQYERALLQYIFYHNWYGYQCDNALCPRDYLSQLFWVDISSEDPDLLQTLDPTVRKETIDVVKAEVDSQTDYKYDMGGIPEEVLDWLEDWTRPTCTHKERKRISPEDGEEKTYDEFIDLFGEEEGVPKWRNAPSAQDRFHRRGVSLLKEKLHRKIGGDDVEVSYAVTCPEDLRMNERLRYRPTVLNETARNQLHFTFYFDQRPFVQEESMYAMIITGCVLILLIGASMLFAKDANELVLNPVEKMIATVHRIRDNPLEAMKMADEEFRLEEAKKSRLQKEARDPMKAFKDIITCQTKKNAAPEVMETVILEKTIIKLGSLLALGFGEAGATIIEHNMHGVDSACVDAMVEGAKVVAIIGSARIRDFATATEVLQTKVMRFVNQIAEIVHGVVDDYCGAPNKNNGDTFLLIWRLSGLEAAQVTRVADMSMLAFTRILGSINTSRVLEQYRGHPGLQQRLGKNCRVNLSFGLHNGWVIEGAVGSEFKIDASYLSPNVSIAESIERATQIYGVNILMAESVISTCSSGMASKCRLIDKVIITGSVKPMELYVVDLDYIGLQVEQPPKKRPWNSKQRFLARQQLEVEKRKIKGEDVNIMALFDEHPDIIEMRKRYTVEFTHIFNMGYQNYSLGEWQVAERLLSRTRTMLTVEDGPSAALLRFMEAPYQFEAPDDWEGIRKIDNTALY